jgi:uncharacterized protein (TIGR04255 family)
MLTEADLSEVFKKPAVREVACEVRFAPRLRVIPEVWRIQDTLAELYPQVGDEQVPSGPNRLVQAYVFADPQNRRLIKVSQENLVIIFNSYTNFEDFKEEALTRISDFSRQFDVGTFQRVGLRYVNHIELPGEDPARMLLKFVNAPVNFNRIEVGAIEQFLIEFKLRAGAHRLTVRGALIPVPTPERYALYILDLDCYSFGPRDRESLPQLLDEFHHEIQVEFLKHITEDYKSIMRGGA